MSLLRCLCTFVLCFILTRGTPVQVETDKGTIKGFIDDKYGVVNFLGVPYAQPPVGNLRWKPPQPHEPWSGVLQVTDYSSSCIQTFVGDYTFPSNVTFSEDCLYLNIWAPNSTNNSRAVMVWIHGGGLVHGGNSEYRLRGGYMSSTGDVIVINFNYRLGVLGWLAHPAFTKDDPNYPTTGNYGLLDQRMVLQWIKTNIQEFGGDPNAVTIMGESAGGSSVCLHLVTAGSKGLFSKAISESNACFAETHSLAEAQQIALNFQKNLNCAGDVQQVLQCMRALPAQKILDLQVKSNFASWAVVDHVEIMEHPYASVANNRINQVSLIAGNVLNEGSLFVQAPPIDYNAYQKSIQISFASFAPLVRAQYPCLNVSNCWDVLANLFGDYELICPNILIVNALAPKMPSYAYVFTHMPLWGNQTMPGKGAFHSSEIAFVFSTLMDIYPYTPEEVVLAHQITQFWTTFSKTSNPSLASGFQWPRYAAPDNSRAILNDNLSVWKDYNSAQCAFWKTVYEIMYAY